MRHVDIKAFLKNSPGSMFAALSSEQRVITVNRPLSNTAASHSASQEAVCLIERRVFGPSS